jgi:hypothetical protein
MNQRAAESAVIAALRSQTALIIGVLCAVFLVFWPGLSGGFIFDDMPIIVRNPVVHLEGLGWVQLVDLWQGFMHSPSRRPLAMLSFGLNHYFSGLDPFAFKLTNVVLHGLNAVLVALLSIRFLTADNTMPPAPDWRRFAAIVVALAWAIHPLQVSAVLYTVQRMEIMALTFILLSLLAYWRGRRQQIKGVSSGWPWFAGAGVAALCAVLCKETGLLVPVFAFCLELTLLRFRASSRMTRRMLYCGYVLAGTAALMVFLFILVPSVLGGGGYDSRDFTLQERLLTQLRILPLYLGWIVWPDPQRYLFYYDAYEPSRSLLQPLSTLGGALFLVSLATAAAVLRKGAPLATLGILLFFASHLLTSNIYPLELVFEHRNYFAIFGILLVGIAGVSWLRRVLRPNVTRFVLAIGILGLGAITFTQASIWGDPLTLAMDLSNKNPQSERAHYDVAEIYRSMSDQNPNSPFFSLSRSAFERSAQVPGASPLPEQALIAMHAMAGSEVEPEWWDRLIEKVQEQPRGPQQITAVRSLLELHDRGHPVDPGRVMDAGIALLNKPGMHPAVFFEFALHALQAVDDVSLAESILMAASIVANDEEWDRRMLEGLRSRGYKELSRTLAVDLEIANQPGETR